MVPHTNSDMHIMVVNNLLIVVLFFYSILLLDDSRTAKHLTHFHRVECLVNLVNLFLRKSDVSCPDVLLHPAKTAGAWDGKYPWLLAEHPCERHLPRCGVVGLSQLVEHLKKILVLRKTLLLILRHYGTVVV